MSILIAQADSALAMFLRKGLNSEGYLAAVVPAWQRIVPAHAEANYQLIIVDLDMLADHQGGAAPTGLIHEIRAASATVCILAMSSRAGVEQRVAALDAGADDFIAKPFSYFELAARIRVMLRRQMAPAEATMQIGELKLNRIARTVSRAGRPIDLTTREFRLLEFLMKNYGRPVSRRDVLVHVWDAGLAPHTPTEPTIPENSTSTVSDGSLPAAPTNTTNALSSMTNIVDVYINYLRQKLGDNRDKRLIHTIRGIGYQLGSSQMTVIPMAPLEPPVQARAS